MASTLARSRSLDRSGCSDAGDSPARAPLTARLNGAGPTGGLAALALADAGWSVILCDPLERDALCSRPRAYALTHSSRRLLQRLGLWHELQPHLNPFERLHLRDAGCERGMQFDIADLPDRSAASSDQAVGWIVRHGDLMRTLLHRLEQHSSVLLQLGPEAAGALQDPPRRDSRSFHSPQSGSAPVDLLLATDGPASATRSAAGIGLWRSPYRQACLTVQVLLRGHDGRQAWELLRPEGPFAVLPLDARSAQVVWSAPAARCRLLQDLPDAAFLEQLAAVLPRGLEVDALIAPPRSFPVDLALAWPLQRGCTVLVGESAHRCHPVGGQGLNLCWRDVAELHELALAVRDGRLPLQRLAPSYARRRLADLLLTLVATDLMVRLFSNRSRLLLPLRRLGLALLSRSVLLRRLSLRVMSEGALQRWR